MAISKWLNILALHLLEIWTHSSSPTSFLLRRQALSFNVSPCGPDPFPQCLTNHLGTGQWLIQMKEQSQTHFVAWGERRERIFHRATLCFCIAFTSSVLSLPRKREGLFMCPTEQLMCNEDMRHLKTGSLLLPGICSPRLQFRCAHRAPTRAGSQWQSGPEAHT